MIRGGPNFVSATAPAQAADQVGSWYPGAAWFYHPRGLTRSTATEVLRTGKGACCSPF